MHELELLGFQSTTAQKDPVTMLEFLKSYGTESIALVTATLLTLLWMKFAQKSTDEVSKAHKEMGHEISKRIGEQTAVFERAMSKTQEIQMRQIQACSETTQILTNQMRQLDKIEHKVDKLSGARS